MSDTYIPPQLIVRTCDRCGARSHVRSDIQSPVQIRRQLEERGWAYRDFLTLCPTCARREDRTQSDGKSPKSARSIPVIGRFFS